MALQILLWDDVKQRSKRGGPAPDLRAGRANVADGATSVSVTFSSPLPDTNYSVLATWQNTDDPAPQFQPFVVTAFDEDGFTLSWAAPTDSSNYKVNWQAIAHG